MEEFFCDYFYKVVSWLYCADLDEYLAGYDPSTSGYYVFHQVGYPMLGGITIAIAAVFAVVYYYVVNHPAYNKWYHWGGFGLLSGIVNLIVGFILCNDADLSGDIAQFMTPEGGEPVYVGAGNCFTFGLGNLIMAFLSFFIISLAIKWWSVNCKRTPF